MEGQWIAHIEYENNRQVGVRFTKKPAVPQDIIELVFDDVSIQMTPKELCDICNMFESIKNKAFIEVMEWLR